LDYKSYANMALQYYRPIQFYTVTNTLKYYRIICLDMILQKRLTSFFLAT